MVTGRSGRFIGTNPSINVSNVRVMRAGVRVLAMDFRNGVIVNGQGLCTHGPATFRALRIFPFPPIRWLLVDVTP